MSSSPARSPVARVTSNALSMLTSDVLNKATTFVLYVMVARYLDGRAFGQLSLALALFYTFQVFATLGLPTPITRGVSRHAARTSIYLYNGSVLALAGSAGSCGALALFLLGMGYAADTTSVVLLISAGLAPYALSTICEAVLRGQERMHLIACANVPVNLAKVAVAWILLERGHGLREVVLLLLSCRVAILLLEWVFVLGAASRPWRAIKRVHLRRTFGITGVFLGIDALLAIRSSLLVVLISRLTMEPEVNVGVFNAAAQLLVPFAMFNQSIAISVFPLLCRRFKADGREDDLRRAVGRLIEVLLAVLIPGVLALVGVADLVIGLFYGEREFIAGATLLRIMAVTVLFQALTSALGQALLAGLKERTALFIVTVSIVAHLICGGALIVFFGVVGAAVTSLLMGLLNCVLHYACAAPVLGGLPLHRLVWRPVAAGVAMMVVATALRSHGVVLAAASGGATYLVVLLGLVFFTSPGWARQP